MIHSSAKIQSILFVCWGNICRSPSAENVMRQRLENSELSAIRCEHDYVVATLLPAPDESRAVKYIQITLGPELPTGAHTDTVIIKTNVAEQPEITIPVTLIAR